MAIQLINTGTGANKGDGDSLRSAFTKINNNFTELTNYLGSTVTDFTEIVEDVVGSMLIHGDHTVGGIKVDYNDTSSKIIINLITPAALVPPSGSTGTVLTKNSTASYDLTWTSLTSVVGPTGPTGPSGSGIVYLGAWSSATIYAENDVVNYQNGSYISTSVNYNSIPTDLTDWDILALPGAIGPQGPAGPVGPSFLNVNSTDSHTIINSGELVFFTTYTGAFVIGGRIRAVAASTTSNWIEGDIVDLVPDIRINIIADHSNGSGTYDLWDITVAGHPGIEGTVGPTGPAGPQGPGADQELNTTSSVVFQSINVTTGMSVTKTLSIGGMPIDGDGHIHILNTLTQSPLMVASNYVGGVRPEIVIRGYGGNRPEGLVNTSGLSGLILESSRGTESSPSAIQANDVLGYVGFGGFDTNRWSTEATLMGTLASFATETWNGTPNTTTNAGTGFLFRTQPNGLQLNAASRQIWLLTSWQNGTATEPPQQILRIGNASQATPTLLTSDGQHFHTSFGATNIEYINVRSKIIGVPDEDHSDFDGDINGITLNVTTLNSGTISIGQRITGTNILTATFILSTGTGVGGTGTYFVNKSQTVSSTNIRGGSDNNTLQSTNGLTFITGRKSGVFGRRSALKKDDTIFNIVGKAQFLDFTTGEGATVADLRFKALENYTTSTRGSAFIIGTVNSGTTATSTRLDLSDQEHKYRSDRHYFTATNATLTNVVVEGHVLPAANSAFDLGTSSTQWRSLYVGTSTIYIGGKALSVTPAGDITVDGSPVGGGVAANTGDITFTATTITAPVNSPIRIVSTDTIYNRALVDLDPVYGNVSLQAWSSENTRSDTNAWTTGTWEINIYGNPYMRFTEAYDLAYWITNTLQNSDPDTVSYSINEGSYISWDGGSSADPSTGFVEIYTSGVNPPGNTTTNITSLAWKYRFNSRFEVGYNNGVNLDSGDQYIGINAGSYIQMYAKGSIDIDNSSQPGSDIEINAGDDIWIRGKDRTTSDSEGGDINIEAGDGGPADAGDGGGGGGDIRIIAGDGGNASSAYMGGVGGTIQMYSGDGGSANAANGRSSNNGGYLELQAGSAGFNDGDPAFGNAGGNLEIRAGNSNNYTDNGGNVIIQPGTNTAGTSTVAGYVRIQVPASSGAGGGSWYFEGDGQTLRFPDGTTQTTAYVVGAGGGVGSTSTLVNGTYTVSLSSIGKVELPGGGVIDGSDYDVEIIAGNDGSSTFGSVTINTQAPPAVYTVVQQWSPFNLDTISTDASETPYIASIVPGMTVTGAGITATTTVTNVTGPDEYGAFFISVSPASETGLNYNETYTFTSAGGVTNRTWDFNSLGEIYLPRGGVIQETDVTNEAFGTTTTSLTLVPGGAANGTQRLEIYGTAGGEGNHIHITSGDQNQTDLYLGNDTQFFAVGAMGQIEVRARPGLDSPSPGTGAESGSPVWIYAGNAGDNGGNVADGASGGDVFLQSGISTSGLGGSIYLASSSGPDGFGFIRISTDGGSTNWTFNKDNELVFPDSSVQTTAFTGTSALLDITNTNGLTTPYYLTFVENRTAGQEVRADVDLVYDCADNLLRTGAFSATNYITVGGILNTNRGVHEKFTTATTASSVVSYDCATTQLFYHATTGTVANWTANFTNLSLEAGRATTVNIIINQGNTGYYPSAVQIGGAAQTLNWQGNTTPSVSANRTDVVTFSILNNNGSYLVLGQLTGF